MKQQDMKPVFTVIHLLILVFIPNFLCQENNVCPTFEDYYTIKNNSNCWYDLTAQYSAVSLEINLPKQTTCFSLFFIYISRKLLSIWAIPSKNIECKLKMGILWLCLEFLVIVAEILGPVIIPFICNMDSLQLVPIS